MLIGTKDRCFLRLIPGLSKQGPKCSMFSIRDATGAKLVTGERWGDDYLVVDGLDEASALKELLAESDFPFEEVPNLPPHLAWALN